MNKKVFSVHNGELKEYQEIIKEGIAPQKGCDILIQDDRGIIYSAKSEHYFDTKLKALWNSYKVYKDRIKQTKERLSDQEYILLKIQNQIEILQRFENE